MIRLSHAALLLIAVALPASLPVPAMAQSPAKDYLFQEQRFSRACRPPLKYAAGACVRRCPAGYEDMGRTCRQRSMRGGGW
ncbi:hypothetical protein ASG40_13085 [Methylobacterium sp. Leaf399]|uniref:hypothetical protein n=1 Tax=unclassified Methylobacterium TaxID=2615210 RepID=UPI0006F2BFC4|nr:MULTISPECIES: hypothetical protein [unclassified Methylobacterium]KQP50855.1 hypothetical protein ASF39_11465 [Methylobacterium sp. Leaf108]KQT07836.1 hypothetical protein ASG40_13085 [Methylobacterium sp. Leaf399]KQT88951.1 hypothetical protein ASG59_13860 [Methylobacterium sp. Leaf466]